jgi:predicted dehydrogenase
VSPAGLRVGIVGCGLIGRKRAEALSDEDELIGCVDVDAAVADALAATYGVRRFDLVDQLLGAEPDVVVVATSHDVLAPIAEQALEHRAHVLVEKPAGLGVAEIERLQRAADAAERQVKVGFNHRFHPALARAAAEVHSGRHGPLLFVRGRYGHGGRLGYEREWRADPRRSGGGELIDQGMHLLDLTHWLAGPLPLHSALLRTQFWDTPAEDNAALLLGEPGDRLAPWATLHVSWTDWKNIFSLEVACETAKIQVDGLVRSYGDQVLRVYRMRPELGPPELEEEVFGSEDLSWGREWGHFADVIRNGGELLGSLADAHYAWRQVEAAYAMSPYEAMRESITS